jgi:hypothetical protein
VLGVLGDALGDVLVALLPLLPPIAQLARAFVPILPPLAKLISLLVKALIPILTPLIELTSAVAGVLANVLAKALQAVTPLLTPLAAIFRGIGAAIRPVINFVRTLADKISRIRLPDWLIPGSPTPLEMGLRGIADAFSHARSVAKDFALPEPVRLAAGGRAVAAAAPTGGGVVINLNGAVLGDVPRVVEHLRREILRMQRRNKTSGFQ